MGSKGEDNVQIRTFMKLAEQELQEGNYKQSYNYISKVKELDAKGKFPPERAADLKLELACL